MPTRTLSDRSVLALSLASLAIAGLVNTAVDPSARTILAVVFVTAGVYGMAQYARAVSKPTLARNSIALWLAFIGVAGIHVGLEAATAVLSASSLVLFALPALTWSTLVGATATTAFLAMREYGAGAGSDTRDDRIYESIR